MGIDSIPYSEQFVQEVRAEVVRLRAYYRIPCDMVVEEDNEHLANEIALRLTAKFAANEVWTEDVTTRTTILIPKTWVDAVKRRFPLIEKLLGSCKHQEIVVSKVHIHNHYHACPLPPGSKDSAVFQWMSWSGKPAFSGTREEWGALQKIGEAVGTDGLERACWEYRMFKERAGE